VNTIILQMNYIDFVGLYCFRIYLSTYCCYIWWQR